MLTIGNDPPQAPAMNDFPSRWRYIETLWNLGGVTLVRLCPPPPRFRLVFSAVI